MAQTPVLPNTVALMPLASSHTHTLCGVSRKWLIEGEKPQTWFKDTLSWYEGDKLKMNCKATVVSLLPFPLVPPPSPLLPHPRLFPSRFLFFLVFLLLFDRNLKFIPYFIT